MIIICAWHKEFFGEEKEMGHKAPYDDDSVTHGMCKECSKKFTEEDEEENKSSYP